MKQNKRYAVTGGIGSGKSTVCGFLQELGYPVLSCDEISRELWGDESYRIELAALFPDCSVNGEIVKEKLTELVFRDKNALARLNKFAHEKIMTRLLEKADQFPLCFCEVPLLFEGGFADLFDGVFVVIRDRETRIAALQERSGMLREEALARMASQFDYEEGLPENCIEIENNGDTATLLSHINEALRQVGILPKSE